MGEGEKRGWDDVTFVARLKGGALVRCDGLGDSDAGPSMKDGKWGMVGTGSKGTRRGEHVRRRRRPRIQLESLEARRAWTRGNPEIKE